MLVICIVVAMFLMETMVFAAGSTTVRILSPANFSVLPFYWMQKVGEPAGVQLEIVLSPDHMRSLSLLSTGHGEYLITGLNVGAKAYNKGVAIQLENVNAWTLDYVVANNAKVQSWRDLIGKKVALPLQGGPLDFLVQYLVKRERIAADQIQFVYAPVPQAVQLFNLGQIDAVVLPEPSVTQLLTNNTKANLAIDVQKEWGKWHGGEDIIPYVGLFVNQTWAQKNNELATSIAAAYIKGVAWLNANPKQAAQLGSEVLGLPESVVAEALQRVRLDVPSRAITKRVVDEHLREMLEFSPELVGDKVPDAGFYR